MHSAALGPPTAALRAAWMLSQKNGFVCMRLFVVTRQLITGRRNPTPRDMSSPVSGPEEKLHFLRYVLQWIPALYI